MPKRKQQRCADNDMASYMIPCHWCNKVKHMSEFSQPSKVETLTSMSNPSFIQYCDICSECERNDAKCMKCSRSIKFITDFGYIDASQNGKMLFLCDDYDCQQHLMCFGCDAIFHRSKLSEHNESCLSKYSQKNGLNWNEYYPDDLNRIISSVHHFFSTN